MLQPLHQLFSQSSSKDVPKASKTPKLTSGLRKRIVGTLLLCISGYLLWYKCFLSWSPMTVGGSKNDELSDAAPLIGMLSLSSVLLSNKKTKKAKESKTVFN